LLKLTRTQYLPIGIDVGADSIKLMQLQITGDDLEVTCAAREAMPFTPAGDIKSRTAVALGIIRRSMRENDFRGRKSIIALPRELVQLKNLRLPIMPAADTVSALQFEAKNLFPFDTDLATLNHLIAGEVRQGSDAKQEIMVLAAKNAEIEQYVEQLHAGGLLLESLDYEPCAIYRSIERFMRRKEDEHDVHVLVDIGLRRSQVLIGRGRDIAMIKPIEIGGQMMRDAVARKLGITVEEAIGLRRRLIDSAEQQTTGIRDAVREAVEDSLRSILEDLAREVSLCLRYYSVTFRGARPLALRTIGGEGGDPQLIRILGGALSVPVTVGRSIQNIDYSRMRATLRQGEMSEWSIAMGLSLKGTDRYFSGREGRPRGTVAPGDAVETEVARPSAVQAIAARLLDGFDGSPGGAHA